MPFSKDKIWSLYECKVYNARQFTTLSEQRFDKEQHQQAAGEDDRHENVDIVESLLLSQEDKPQSHRTVKQGIHRSSVLRIIHKDMRLKGCKKKRAQQLTEAHSMHALFSVCSLRDDNKQTYMKTEACKLCSRVFLIFLPNIIKINAYNFKLYRLIIGSFFETQCTILQITQQYHRLRGSASPVLTATLHSYGSLAWLSDFFPPQP